MLKFTNFTFSESIKYGWSALSNNKSKYSNASVVVIYSINSLRPCGVDEPEDTSIFSSFCSTGATLPVRI